MRGAALSKGMGCGGCEGVGGQSTSSVDAIGPRAGCRTGWTGMGVGWVGYVGAAAPWAGSGTCPARSRRAVGGDGPWVVGRGWAFLFPAPAPPAAPIAPSGTGTAAAFRVARLGSAASTAPGGTGGSEGPFSLPVSVTPTSVHKGELADPHPLTEQSRKGPTTHRAEGVGQGLSGPGPLVGPVTDVGWPPTNVGSPVTGVSWRPTDIVHR